MAKNRGHCRGADRGGAALVDLAGRAFCNRMADRGRADARFQAPCRAAEASGLRAAGCAVRLPGGGGVVVGPIMERTVVSRRPRHETPRATAADLSFPAFDARHVGLHRIPVSCTLLMAM